MSYLSIITKNNPITGLNDELFKSSKKQPHKKCHRSSYCGQHWQVAEQRPRKPLVQARHLPDGQAPRPPAHAPPCPPQNHHHISQPGGFQRQGFQAVHQKRQASPPPVRLQRQSGQAGLRGPGQKADVRAGSYRHDSLCWRGRDSERSGDWTDEEA